jgi:archaeal flagellar protein FlaI
MGLLDKAKQKSVEKPAKGEDSEKASMDETSVEKELPTSPTKESGNVSVDEVKPTEPKAKPETVQPEAPPSKPEPKPKEEPPKKAPEVVQPVTPPSKPEPETTPEVKPKEEPQKEVSEPEKDSEDKEEEKKALTKEKSKSPFGEEEEEEKTPEEIEKEKQLEHEREMVEGEVAKLTKGESILLPVDRLIETLEKAPNKMMTLPALKSALKMEIHEVEYLTRVLSKRKILSVTYPLNIFSPPKIKLLEHVEETKKKHKLAKEKKLIENYVVSADYVTADVNIWSVPFENTPIYEVIPHGISENANHLLDDMVDKLAAIVNMDASEAIGLSKAQEQKEAFYEAAKQVIKDNIVDIEEGKLAILAGILLHKSFGLGDMEVIMSDNWLEEVAVNGHEEPLSVYHKRYGWLKTTKFFDKESEIYNFTAQIGRKVGKQINALSPIMDAHLDTGDRVAATLFPISTAGNTLTIRRFSRNPWTVVHMIDPKNHTMSKEVMSLLWMSVQYELNMLVVGGTASGKTSVLNTLCSLIPPTNRIISIEDTRELSLPKALHWNWVPLASKSANAEGQGEVSMLDLMVASLRMRPDRIIVGEIRRKAQAESLFEAMHTGHSVAATMHADTAEQVKRRLTQPPIDIPENEIQALQLVLVQYRDRRRGIRRTLEVAELLPGTSDERVNLNYLYRWRPRRDQFVKSEDSIRVVEDMNLHTGMTQNEIEENLAQKGAILQWMLDNKITDVDKVGHVMRIYYKYPQLLIDTVADKGGSEILTEENV